VKARGAFRREDDHAEHVYGGYIHGAVGRLAAPCALSEERARPRRVLAGRFERVALRAEWLHVCRLVRPAVGEGDSVIELPPGGQQHATRGASVLESERDRVALRRQHAPPRVRSWRRRLGARDIRAYALAFVLRYTQRVPHPYLFPPL
jgi:hypothetical protein